MEENKMALKFSLFLSYNARITIYCDCAEISHLGFGSSGCGSLGCGHWGVVVGCVAFCGVVVGGMVVVGVVCSERSE